MNDSTLPGYMHPDLWLDEGHAVEFITLPGDDEPCGGIVWHRNSTPDPNFPWCAAGFYWRDVPGKLSPGPRWQLVSREPLHLEPSLLCVCGAHGFIRGGKWIPA